MLALTLADPSGETTQWMGDMMARPSGISASAVRQQGVQDDSERANIIAYCGP